MKTNVVALMAALISGPAFAHPSTMPHEHPHAASYLPDLGAMAVAALLVAVAALVLHRYRRGA